MGVDVLGNFILAADQLTKYSAAAQKIPQDSHTLGTLSGRLQILQEMWDDVQSTHRACVSEPDEDTDVEVLSTKFLQCTETFVALYGSFTDLKQKLQQGETRAADTPSPSTPHGIKLTACDTEIFSGDYLSWPAFRDMFEALYIKHSKLGPVEKLFYLRSRTTGTANAIISGFPLTNSSFDLAWKALKAEYENTRILVNNQVKQLFNLPQIEGESAKSIRTLQRQINDCMAILKAQSVDTTNWDPILVFACSNRLPNATLTLWEQSLKDPTKVPTWADMNKFLDGRYQVLESIADISSCRTQVGPRGSRPQAKPASVLRGDRSNTFHGSQNTARNPTCQYCQGPHTIRKCNQFLGLPPTERRDLVRASRLCFNCLGVKHNASTCPSTDYQHKFPRAAKILAEEIYVDDVLSGAHSIEDAKEAQTELLALLEKGKFPLRKWTSNSPRLLEDLPQEHILNDSFLNLDEGSTTKTLGIRWNAKEDFFFFTTQPILLSREPTKREVFSQIAKLFDPAGWLAPIIIKAKILLQYIWAEGTEWNEPILRPSLDKWETFVHSFSNIQEIRIPRWVKFSPTLKLQVHGFCDSSERAYAATLYTRVESRDGRIHTHLLCAKTKVAPLKTVSLPRLELCGSVLLSRMVKSYIPQLPAESVDIHLWTDSSIVLAWLGKHPSTWKTFVANRTSEILDNVGNAPWRHVRSAENPADLATRGLSPNDLRNNALWWNGPSWLGDPSTQWPNSSPTVPPNDLLEKNVVCAHMAEQHLEEDLLRRFSALPRALRVLTYVFRFSHRALRRTRNQSLFHHDSVEILHAELNFIKTRLTILSQCAAYSREREALTKGKPLHPKSSILSLNPMLDTNQLMRVSGRLAHADLGFNERNPIIVPCNSRLAELLVDFTHDLSLHGGTALTVRILRQAFWIPKLKNLVKQRIRACKTCILHKKQTKSQLMAALPPSRCNFTPPFTHTGVDFAGPFTIKSFAARNCRTSKGYTCLFVCFTTKAIHLEAVSDLSSAAFLAAFARFVARRGLPKEMYSDQGTNFIGADAALKKEFRSFLKSVAAESSQRYGVQGLKWNFIPPGAPHMGGLWEAGVKSFKSHFRKVGETHKFTFEEFSTLLARIEACLNSRPISAMSADSTDLNALTPGHFLRGEPLITFPECDQPERSLSILNRWERVKCLQQHFCRRWKEEYLRELQTRSKWKTPQENVKVDDLVVIKQENLPCTEWRLGRVIQVHPGADGRVRVATIRTQQGNVQRPVVKLCPLPIT